MTTMILEDLLENSLSRLEAACKRCWAHIRACEVETEKQRVRIASVLQDEHLLPADCAMVVFGSLARGEITPSSDVDWTLLVDAPADPQHQAIASAIEHSLASLRVKSPGPTGLFGDVTSSHEVINQIGGHEDTNHNTTRRMLLLLESRELSNSPVRDRVLRQVLRRYLEEDKGYHELHDLKVKVPRFLLNDIARFWRTMTVDYAAKRRARDWKGWALRNFKLRMSRKLIFAAGLAMCLSCELHPPAALRHRSSDDPADVYAALQDFLIRFANCTPLQTVAAFALITGVPEIGGALFDAYDEFLQILMDTSNRQLLDDMDLDDALNDTLFDETRRISSLFQENLTRLFFDTSAALTQATQRYGVF